ncbi:Oligopeptide transport ATP-binding protein OppD [Austwickia sp. TVS 96-490-7B]|uniref:ABC transporter ATP-binding protein n=1 Tax=Austwickia sp. TVS 96-490-7B TaxID=2830843 RepID=UPI001DC8B593|nr:ABC transporter ATP-binding protein [Austwickia sp. TVS 96-490-7B]MBW3084259.1 Oligopeptide transport ATP-binding protein OppD [Austwickia sp. TVS 96-490-7B]
MRATKRDGDAAACPIHQLYQPIWRAVRACPSAGISPQETALSNAVTATSASDDPPIVRVQGLRITCGAQTLVDGVDVEVRRGHAVALVGESGSGKTLTTRAMMGLFPAGATVDGCVEVDGQQMLGASQAQWRAVRGHTIGYVAQDPRTALNPLVTVGAHVAEPLRAQGVSRRDAAHRARELLDRMCLPDPARTAQKYPGELSGGQRQRVGLAMALATDPALLIADEPTSALDVSVQAELMPLLQQIALERALLLVTHDVAVAAALCPQVVVLRAGRVVDAGPSDRVWGAPEDSYVDELVTASRAMSLPTCQGES